MSTIHLGSPISVEVDGEDLTPYLADAPSASVTIGGHWQAGGDVDGPYEFPPGSIRLASFRAFGVRLELEPWFYRQMSGRKHPRVADLRRAYRAKRRHW